MDIHHLNLEQLTTLLAWFDGHAAYRDLCASIRARIEQLRPMH